jgi:hypothetical protein
MRLLLTQRAQKKVCHLPVAVLEERRSRTHGMEPAPRCDWRPVAGLERAWQLLHRRVRTEPPPTDCSLEFHMESLPCSLRRLQVRSAAGGSLA